MTEKRIEVVKLSLVVPDPTQPRQEFDPEDLETLKMSIASQGLLNPIVVEPMEGGKFLLVDGERRYRAMTQLGLKECPVSIVKPMDEIGRFVYRFHLQEKHKSWSLFDKAQAVKRMLESGLVDANELREMLGLTVGQVSSLMDMLILSPHARQLADARRVPLKYLRNIATVLRKNTERTLTRQLEQALLDKIQSGIVLKPWEINDYGLAIEYGGRRIAKKIIDDSQYTPTQALTESKAGSARTFKKWLGFVRYGTWYTQRVLQDGSYVNMTKENAADARQLIAKLESVLKHPLADAAEKAKKDGTE